MLASISRERRPAVGCGFSSRRATSSQSLVVTLGVGPHSWVMRPQSAARVASRMEADGPSCSVSGAAAETRQSCSWDGAPAHWDRGTASDVTYTGKYYAAHCAHSVNSAVWGGGLQHCGSAAPAPGCRHRRRRPAPGPATQPPASPRRPVLPAV